MVKYILLCATQIKIRVMGKVYGCGFVCTCLVIDDEFIFAGQRIAYHYAQIAGVALFTIWAQIA